MTSECLPHQVQLAGRSPPSVDQLRATKAGLHVRRLRAHSHSTIVALASSLLEVWKAAAAAEERRNKRTAALGGGSHGAAAHVPSKLHADGTSASVAGGGASGASGASAPVTLHTNPTRQTGQLLLAEALKAGGGEGVSGGATDLTLASRLEAAVFALSEAATGKISTHVRYQAGGEAATGKAYKSRLRTIVAALRAPRAGSVRKRLREGDLSAEGLCAMVGNGQASATDDH